MLKQSTGKKDSSLFACCKHVCLVVVYLSLQLEKVIDADAF